MTNFEKKMLELAQEILKNGNLNLHMVLCNAASLPCSKCPINDKCYPEVDLDKWLREEAENE